MIRVEDLTKKYVSSRGVDHISFSLEEGKTFGLLGPNGAGKSTIIRMLAGTMLPTKGRISLNGSTVDPSSIAYRKQLGYLPETAPLYDHMDVSSYLRFVSELKYISAGERQTCLERVLSQCRLENVANRVIGRLSKGYRQRVGLAQALIGDPSLLILDEPTAGLDPRQTSTFRKLIQTMQGRRTILLSSHILSEVRALCNRVLIINEGKTAAHGDLDELLTKDGAQKGYRAEIVGRTEEVTAALKRLKEVRSLSIIQQRRNDRTLFLLLANEGADPRDSLVRVIGERGWRLLELCSVRRDLEHLFLDAIAGSDADEDV